MVAFGPGQVCVPLVVRDIPQLVASRKPAQIDRLRQQILRSSECADIDSATPVGSTRSGEAELSSRKDRTKGIPGPSLSRPAEAELGAQVRTENAPERYALKILAGGRVPQGGRISVGNRELGCILGKLA